jgi:hypothetical protein
MRPSFETPRESVAPQDEAPAQVSSAKANDVAQLFIMYLSMRGWVGFDFFFTPLQGRLKKITPSA